MSIYTHSKRILNFKIKDRGMQMKNYKYSKYFAVYKQQSSF